MGLSHVIEAVVAVDDVPTAIHFHTAALDLVVLGRHADGSVTLGAPPGDTGRVRFTQSAAHPSGIAWDPRPWDIGPRMLGMYSARLPDTVARVRAAGGISGDPVSYPYGTSELCEIVARSPSGLYWTMPQLPDLRMPSPALDADPARAHGELHTAVLVVADHEAAMSFFRAGGLDVLFDGEMRGEPFETLLDMPVGGVLRLTFLIGPDRTPGRLEILSFTGVGEQADLTEVRNGLRRLVFAATDVSATRAVLIEAGAVLLADGALRGPVGIEIELIETDGKHSAGNGDPSSSDRSNTA